MAKKKSVLFEFKIVEWLPIILVSVVALFLALTLKRPTYEATFTVRQAEFPAYFVWDSENKTLTIPKNGADFNVVIESSEVKVNISANALRGALIEMYKLDTGQSTPPFDVVSPITK